MRRAGDVVKGRCLWALLLLLLLSGCISHVQQLREAQDEFNRAATLENEIRLDPRKADAATLGNVTASYRLALSDLTDLMEKNRDELEKDKLIGVAYTLKALTEWRLGDYAATMDTVNAARGYPEGTLYHRDRLLLMALRGLVKNDQAFRLMADKKGSYEQIKTLLSEALQDMGELMPALSSGDNLRVYLTMARLGVLKNWQDLRSSPDIPRPPSFSAEMERKAWCHHLKASWGDFEKEMNGLSTREAEDLKAWWGALLNPKELCPNE